MAGVLISPGFDNDVRKRSSSYKGRGGSPSFKELLRKRCKERFKATRCALLNQFRNLNTKDDVKDIISSMVREEAMVLSSGDESLNQMDEMVTDVHPSESSNLSEFEEWLLEEYDMLIEEEAEDYLLNQSICPLCLRSPLDDISTYSICKSCNIALPPLNLLKPALNSVYDNHASSSCRALPSCFILEHSLYFGCEDCSTIIHVTDIA